MFQNKIFQASVIVAIILVSSAIFLSQADRITGKAQSAAITGTMVLFDQNPTDKSQVLTRNFDQIIFLPSDNCVGYVNYCEGDNTIWHSKCTRLPLMHLGGNEYLVGIGETVLTENSTSGGSVTIYLNPPTVTSVTLYATTQATIICPPSHCVSAEVYDNKNKIVLASSHVCSSSTACNGVNTVSNVYPQYLTPVNITLTGGEIPATLKVTQGPLYTVSHVDVSYKC